MKMQKLMIAAGTAAMMAMAAPIAEASAIVYTGQDASIHTGAHAQAGTLVANAVRFAGGAIDPKVGVFTGGGGFGGGQAALLTSLGFTDVTSLSAAGLSGMTLAQLLAYDVLYFGPTTDATTIGHYTANAAKILAYTGSGGGLFVEPEVFDAGSWSWVPYAGLLGHSGPTNVGGETVVLDPGAPAALNAGLSNAGLSNWGFSIHSTFATPGAAGFSYASHSGSLTSPIGVTIYRDTTVPEPGLLALLGLGVAGIVRRRRQ